MPTLKMTWTLLIYLLFFIATPATSAPLSYQNLGTSFHPGITDGNSNSKQNFNPTFLEDLEEYNLVSRQNPLGGNTGNLGRPNPRPFYRSESTAVRRAVVESHRRIARSVRNGTEFEELTEETAMVGNVKDSNINLAVRSL